MPSIGSHSPSHLYGPPFLCFSPSLKLFSPSILLSLSNFICSITFHTSLPQSLFYSPLTIPFLFLFLTFPHKLWKIYYFTETQLLHLTSGSVRLRGKFYLINMWYKESTWRWNMCPVLMWGVCLQGNQPFPDKENSSNKYLECSVVESSSVLTHMQSHDSAVCFLICWIVAPLSSYAGREKWLVYMSNWFCLSCGVCQINCIFPEPI